MATRTVSLFTHLDREFGFALLGLEHMPGRVTHGWPPEMHMRRDRLKAALLRRHYEGTALKDELESFIAGIDEQDWPRIREDDGCSGMGRGFRTPLDVAVVWGLDWLDTDIDLSISRLLAGSDRSRELTRRIEQLASLGASVRAAQQLRCAAIGGHYDIYAGRDPVSRKVVKPTFEKLDRAWSEILNKMAPFGPLMIFPVISTNFALLGPRKLKLVAGKPNRAFKARRSTGKTQATHCDLTRA